MNDFNQLTQSLILFRCKLDNVAPYNRWSLKVTSFVFYYTIFFEILNVRSMCNAMDFLTKKLYAIVSTRRSRV